MGGTDASAFSINSDGELTFNKSPNFEAKPSYSVDVVAKAGMDLTVSVTVTITNVQEDGTVTLVQPQPQVGKPVMAEISDPDGDPVNTTWQWARSSDMVTWEDIETGGKNNPYTPTGDDVGMYLRATATYGDPAPPDDDPATGTVNEDLTSTPGDTGISSNPVEPIRPPTPRRSSAMTCWTRTRPVALPITPTGSR